AGVIRSKPAKPFVKAGVARTHRPRELQTGLGAFPERVIALDSGVRRLRTVVFLELLEQKHARQIADFFRRQGIERRLYARKNFSGDVHRGPRKVEAQLTSVLWRRNETIFALYFSAFLLSTPAMEAH